MMEIASSSEKKFLFSVIMPIYNSERYLSEAIDSILKQSIGFKENIQIILVDNGSNDNSVEICAKYKALFPDNIVYIQNDENMGTSVGRNIGMQYATGKYINFMDSDDRWWSSRNVIDCISGAGYAGNLWMESIPQVQVSHRSV